MVARLLRISVGIASIAAILSADNRGLYPSALYEIASSPLSDLAVLVRLPEFVVSVLSLSVFFALLNCVPRIFDLEDHSRAKAASFWDLCLLVCVAISTFLHATAEWPGSEALIIPLGLYSGKYLYRFVFRREFVAGCNNGMLWTLFLVPIVLLLVTPAEGGNFKYDGVSRISGGWGNPNKCGFFLCVACCSGLSIIISHARSNGIGPRATARVRFWYGVFCVLFMGMAIYALARTYSRGAWAAFICGSLWLVLHPSDAGVGSAHGNSARRVNVRYLNIVLIATCAAILCLSYLYLEFDFRNTYIARLYSAIDSDDFSLLNRLSAWNSMMEMILTKPLLGHGFGKSVTVFEMDYQSLFLPVRGAFHTNSYLKIAVSAGVPALLCFLGACRVLLAPSCVRPQAIGLSACFVSALIMFFSGGLLLDVQAAFVFWFVREAIIDIEDNRVDLRCSF